ncbi:conserved hypothetical protein [uncultured Desulfobacterium sp.]|uniref:Chondroitin 4-O-sulfotransferase n=1 Tax=uncultured Desulfobacterium sp. TaxID=201089 RepID=A0A445N436_9BACT|nr:conserved hypothetical protein [uncultured Desulfobacterium sp.]
MIISYKYKFIFIKTQKTAGTSIEVYLSKHCGKNDILTPINPHVAPHLARNYKAIWNPFPEIVENKGLRLKSTLKKVLKQNKFYNHIPARTIKNRISKKTWNDYFKFCVERNPWDKTLSHYYYINAKSGKNITFDQYLDGGKFCLNYPKYTDPNFNLMVNKVIEYGSLNVELTRIFKKLGVPFGGTLSVRAKSEYRKDRRPYQQIITKKQRQIIEKAFAKEIEMHGYKF